MLSSFAEKYSNQIPVYTRFDKVTVLNIIGSVASIAGIGLYFSEWWKTFSPDTKSIFIISYLFTLLLFAITYIVFRELSKKHRYAQTIYHVHFVNHLIRDHIACLKNGDVKTLSETLNEIVDSISTAFSIVEGRQCRCSFKSLDPGDEMEIKTLARDHISRKSTAQNSTVRHFIHENSDFENVFLGLGRHVRYYRGINLKNKFRHSGGHQNYKNSSFKIYGTPRRHPFLWFTFVTGWNLPYNSTLVWPVRFITDASQWPPSTSRNGTGSALGLTADIKGFLCIDANTSKAFTSQEAVELGAAFADALYILFDALDSFAKGTPTTVKPTP